MTKLQSIIVGAGLVVSGIGLSVYGWVAKVPEAVTFGALVFGAGLGALGLPAPTQI